MNSNQLLQETTTDRELYSRYRGIVGTPFPGSSQQSEDVGERLFPHSTEAMLSLLGLSKISELSNEELFATLETLIMTGASVTGAGNIDERLFSESINGKFAKSLWKLKAGEIKTFGLAVEFASHCREEQKTISEDSNADVRMTVISQKVLRQELKNWSLFSHLYGTVKALVPLEDSIMQDNDESEVLKTTEEIIMNFIRNSPLANKLYRILIWLEDCASKDIDWEVEDFGCSVGVYFASQGQRKHTQAAIASGVETKLKHIDPDAVTRECGNLHLVDESFEETLLKDVWKLFQAGKFDEAKSLCRAAGQPWRTLFLSDSIPKYPFWDSNFDWGDAFVRDLQEGVGLARKREKRTLFRISQEPFYEEQGSQKLQRCILGSHCSNIKPMIPFCDSWQTTLWSFVRTSLDALIDYHLAENYWNREDQCPSKRRKRNVLENWPEPVVEQIPESIDSLFIKILSNSSIKEDIKEEINLPVNQFQVAIMKSDRNKALDAVLLMASNLKSGEKCDSAKLRFVVHALILMDSLLKEENSEESIDLQRPILHYVSDYVRLLLLKGNHRLVPIYLQYLTPSIRQDFSLQLLKEKLTASEEEKKLIFSGLLLGLPAIGEGSVISALDCLLNDFEGIVSRPSLNSDSDAVEFSKRGFEMRASILDFIHLSSCEILKSVNLSNGFGVENLQGFSSKEEFAKQVLPQFLLRESQRLFQSMALAAYSSQAITVDFNQISETIGRIIDRCNADSKVIQEVELEYLNFEAWITFFQGEVRCLKILSLFSPQPEESTENCLEGCLKKLQIIQDSFPTNHWLTNSGRDQYLGFNARQITVDLLGVVVTKFDSKVVDIAPEFLDLIKDKVMNITSEVYRELSPNGIRLKLLERKVPGSRSLKLTFICKVEQEGQLKIAQELLVKLLSTLLKGPCFGRSGYFVVQNVFSSLPDLEIFNAICRSCCVFGWAKKVLELRAAIINHFGVKVLESEVFRSFRDNLKEASEMFSHDEMELLMREEAQMLSSSYEAITNFFD